MIAVLDGAATLKLPLIGTILIEASAGTGKTYAIGNLYLRLLMEGYTVDQILVVTFTVAATEELRGRIARRLYQARSWLLAPAEAAPTEDLFLQQWRDALDDTEHGTVLMELAEKRLKLALRSMDEAAIFTIHGFCQRALTEHAFNSRQSFEVEMLCDDGLLWESAIKDWWRCHTTPLRQWELALFQQTVPALEKLIAWHKPLRKPGLQLLPEIKSDLASLYAQWHQLLAQCDGLAKNWKTERKVLEAALRSDVLMRRRNVYKLGQLADLLAQLDDYFSSGSLFDIPDLLESVSASVLHSQCKKGKHEPRFDHAFFVGADTLLRQVKALRQSFKLRTLAEVHCFATQQVAQVKAEAGQMGFDDQILQLEQALAKSPPLVEAMRSRYPVAMIDEFQDTDAAQYGIFSHLYGEDDCALQPRQQASCLIMIGDPKQAIYSFRGGDIFTYMRAKAEADAHFTLNTNWRSTPRLITAVNALFQHRVAPFVYDAIPFHPVAAAERAHAPLRNDGNEVTPFTIWHVGDDAISAGDLAALMHAYTANEIVRLIDAGGRGTLTLGEAAVQPGDIAVLVRSHFEAAAVRDALRQRGVHAVASGTEYLFASDEASGFALLLRAVINYGDQQLLRQALASSLLALDWPTMQAWMADEGRWIAWGEGFRSLHRAWQQQGFMAMFQFMLRTLKVGERLATRSYPERRMTNLLHLAELMQQESFATTGMDALLRWLLSQREREDDESLLRLENDAALVRIVTIHASKGLEYPIVFLPYMWGCRTREQDDPLPFFDAEQGLRCLDAGSASRSAHLLLAEKERLAEDVRLLYVATTRAASKLYLGWGIPSKGKAEKTAAAWLLHASQGVQDLDTELPDGLKGGGDVVADLQRLSELSQGAIAVLSIPHAMPEMKRVDVDHDPPPLCQAAQFNGRIATDWRIASFSSLTRDVHQPAAGKRLVSVGDAVLDFPAGSRTGLFLHQLLEHLDFQGDIAQQSHIFTTRYAPQFGLDPACDGLVGQWIGDVVQTPLDGTGLRLAMLSKAQRLDELKFDFSVAGLDIDALNLLLASSANQPLQPIAAESCRGLMTGFIDLVFAHQGQFYIVDYKSNRLGATLSDYTPDRLAEAVYDRRYDLQYLLYTLALHRYLGNRIRDYDYETHVGGAYYLFLRAMRPQHGVDYGVYANRPQRALIEKLDAMMG
ncbi:MAG: exodeoxyribonuclease V subunit beta [Mariprofundales bacterium]